MNEPHVMTFWQVVILHFLAAMPPTIFSLAALLKVIKTHKAVNGGLDQRIADAVKKVLK